MAGYIYDAAAAAVIIFCACAGYRKGVLRTVLNTVCFIVAFAAASFFSSQSFTAPVYEKYFKERMAEALDIAVQNAKSRAAEELTGYAEDIADDIIDRTAGGNDLVKDIIHEYIPQGGEIIREGLAGLVNSGKIDLPTLLTNPVISGKIEEMAEKYSVIASEEINDRMPLGIRVEKEDISRIITDNNAWEAVIYEALGIGSSGGEDKGLSAYIESTVVRPIFLRFLSIILWAAVFSIVNFLLRIIVSVVLVIRRLEPVKACDSAAGAVLGAVFGIAAVTACCAVIILIVRFTGGMTYMNEDIFSETLIFGRIYDTISRFGF